MGFAIFLGISSLIVGTAAAVNSAVQNQNNAAYNRQQSSLNMANDYLATLNSQYDILSKSLTELSILEKNYYDALHNKEVNLGLIEQYTEALNSETGELSKDNQFLSQKYLLNQQLNNINSETELYEKTQAENQKNYVISSFSDYAQMMKDKSIKNVLAGASGNKGNVYRIENLIANNQLRDFIGSDMIFDYNESSEGSFSKMYILQQKAIKEQVKTYEYNANAIMANLYKVDQEYRDQIEALTYSNEDFDSIINDYISDESNMNSRKYYESAIKRAQENARSALNEYRNNASAGGISREEIDRVTNQYQEKFRELGYVIGGNLWQSIGIVGSMAKLYKDKLMQDK